MTKLLDEITSQTESKQDAKPTAADIGLRVSAAVGAGNQTITETTETTERSLAEFYDRRRDRAILRAGGVFQTYRDYMEKREVSANEAEGMLVEIEQSITAAREAQTRAAFHLKAMMAAKTAGR